jgi:hypothetical protein
MSFTEECSHAIILVSLLTNFISKFCLRNYKQVGEERGMKKEYKQKVEYSLLV